MGRLAADHAAEGDEAVEVARAGREADRGREFERAGHFDGFVMDPGIVEGGARPGEQAVSDVAVERRDDDEHAGRTLEAWAGQGGVAFHCGFPVTLPRASGSAGCR